MNQKYKTKLPTIWAADQVWAMIELLDIISGTIWDNYVEKLLDRTCRKASGEYDHSGNQRPPPSYEFKKNRTTTIHLTSHSPNHIVSSQDQYDPPSQNFANSYDRNWEIFDSTMSTWKFYQ